MDEEINVRTYVCMYVCTKEMCTVYVGIVIQEIFGSVKSSVSLENSV